MSLESERRAIGQRLTESRAEIRDAMRAARASTFKRDLNALESGSRVPAALRTIEPKGSRAAAAGVAYWDSSKDKSTGAGIASPLTEGSYAAREFYASRYLTTYDGIFVMQVDPVKKVVMSDANSAEVVQIFAEPA
jgi:hypothetical protein